jgi:autotransporter family porin
VAKRGARAPVTVPATTVAIRPASTVPVVPPPVSGAAPARFGTSAVGSPLPSSQQCAAWVRASPAPAEVRQVNAAANATPGQPLAGATGLLARVDGAFTGTTEQILRWAACKWGIDEDVVKAQAAVESWWRADTLGGWASGDAASCEPDHALGVDGREDSCPESFGLLQVRYPYHQIAFPEAATSSALNVDYAYAVWRRCYVGTDGWLGTVEHGAAYRAGDADGCLGAWFAGHWHTAAADGYVSRVRTYRAQRIWTTAAFRAS